jgi:hypothetical protein
MRSLRFGRARWWPLFGVLLMITLAQLASSATVRGQLDRVASNGAHSPAAGVTVTVRNQSGGRSVPVRTGQDGLYYLYNVSAGSYTLEVWASSDAKVPPKSYPITVVEPLTDIPPIAVQ